MSESYGIFTQKVIAGVGETFQHGGSYVHVLRADGVTDVSLITDTGDKITLPPGHGLPIANFKWVKADAPSAAAGTQVNITLYLGSVPLTKPTVVHDDRTFTTSDVVTVPAKGLLPVKLFSIPGAFAINGLNWKRREIFLTNTDAAIDVWVRGSASANFGSQQANLDGIKLPHGDGAPVPLRTDDQLQISNYDQNNAVQVRVFQIWVRDY